MDKVKEFPKPKFARQVRRFIGMVGWYRRFIKDFSSMASPITDLMSSKRKFEWTDEADEAFEVLKRPLYTAPVFSHPDFSKPFIIQWDASSVGIDSVLYQVGDYGLKRPIAFLSQKLNSAQRNYSVTDSVEVAQKDLCGRLARWSLKFKILISRLSIEKES